MGISTLIKLKTLTKFSVSHRVKIASLKPVPIVIRIENQVIVWLPLYCIENSPNPQPEFLIGHFTEGFGKANAYHNPKKNIG